MNLGELGNAFMFATVCDMFVNLIGYNIYLRVLCQNSGQASQTLPWYKQNRWDLTVSKESMLWSWE